MRNLERTVLLLVCLGCSDGVEPTPPNPQPEDEPAGAAGASGSASAGESEGGSSESGGDGGANGDGEPGGGAGASAGDGGSDGEELLPDEPDNGTLSGTRLKAEWYDFGGTRVFAGFYDTALQTPCTPGAWSDGKVYCIPVSTTTLGYTTEACTEMLGHISFNPTCEHPSPDYLVVPADASPCTAASGHVYRLAATPTMLTTYYALQNGGCAGPFSTGINSDTFLVTGEVMPSELVEFTREAPADPGRISRQYIVADDGARLAVAPYDRELDSDCTPKANLADKSRGSCPPTDTRDVVFYGDMDCKQSLVSAAKTCPKPRFGRQLVDHSCAQGDADYFAVADAVKPASVFVVGATCEARSVPTTSAFYAVSDSVTVQQLTRDHDRMPDRELQPIYFSDGTKRYLEQNLYDTAHDTECQVNVLPDGTIVCVPFGSSASAFYSDDTCTDVVRTGLVYFGAEHCDAPSPLPPFIINPGAGSTGCRASYEIRERGPLHTGTPYLSGGTTCEPYTALEPYRLFELGAVRPFSEFPTATKVRDP
jgi:hypothetical protein